MESSDLSTLGRVGVIGAGAVGSALARTLAAGGARMTAVAARDQAHAAALAAVLPGQVIATTAVEVVAAADLVLLAVADDAITPLAQTLPWRPDQAAVHLSGAKHTGALAAAQERGARIAALHPLMTFPRLPLDTPVAALLARMAGCVWALDCDDAALREDLEAMVAALDGQVVRLRAENRIPYHISGVLMSNYVAALAGAAVQLWGAFGVERDEALRALLPLLRATVESLATSGLPAALTGPLARGDVGTVAAHLDWLRDAAETNAEGAALLDAYRALGLLALPLARAKGALTPEAAAALEALLRAERRDDENG
ncbi:MAG: hypothetical protein OJF49_003318 [Ktedonobacterales bacterium]|jgi:predicted short-subunit dehydrogenase-like oxidoreductase (DUF2520 family)|nr:MAG: hypothetical protein OJF49_003318 [Ktedonobacterales bacterium]